MWSFTRSKRIPWSYGYGEYRWDQITKILSDPQKLEWFRPSRRLPENYGYGLDERIVEYPWLIERIGHNQPGTLLDAGSTLNFEVLLDHPSVSMKAVTIYTLAPEKTYPRNNVSYIYGDLRDTVLKDELFDQIICISTLEHVGMDNTALYTSEIDYNERRTQDYIAVIMEFRRLLRPGGSFYLTVPYGCYENHVWLQQFDASMLTRVIETFEPGEYQSTFFRYFTGKGWQSVSQSEANDAHYNNIHNRQAYVRNDIAAAEAVACIEFRK